MERYALHAVNMADEPVNKTAEVSHFINDSGYFRVCYTNMGNNMITLTTPKGEYILEKHKTLNIFKGTCNGHKVDVSLKKLVGEARYW